MKFEIETYRGQLIEYDDSYDKFVCDISIEDKSRTAKRLSLSDIRKEIDQFIKVNVDFHPFKVLSVDTWDKDDFKIICVSAISTDGKFVTYTEGDESYKSYSGKKDIKNWMAYDGEAVSKKSELKKVKDAAVTSYNKSLKAITSTLKPIDLSKYDNVINPD